MASDLVKVPHIGSILISKVEGVDEVYVIH